MQKVIGWVLGLLFVWFVMSLVWDHATGETRGFHPRKEIDQKLDQAIKETDDPSWFTRFMKHIGG